MRHAFAIPTLLAGLGLSLSAAPAAAQQADVAHMVDPTAPTYLHPIEAGVGDVGPGSTSLRIIERGLDLPSGFARVYRSPIDGHLMRVDGALHAVFPRSRYTPSQNGDVPSVPDGTVFYIGTPVGPFVAGGQPSMNAANTSSAAAPAARLNMRVDAQPASRRLVHIDDVPSPSAQSSDHPSDHPSGHPSVHPSGHPSGHAPAHVLSDHASHASHAGHAGHVGHAGHALLIPTPTTPVHPVLAPSSTIVTDESYRRERIHALLLRAAHADHEANWNAVMGKPDR
jgi:hypothetical protein